MITDVPRSGAKYWPYAVIRTSERRPEPPMPPRMLYFIRAQTNRALREYWESWPTAWSPHEVPIPLLEASPYIRPVLRCKYRGMRLNRYGRYTKNGEDPVNNHPWFA